MVRFFIDQTLYMDSSLFNFVTSWHVDEFPLNFDLLPYLLPMQDLEKTAEMENLQGKCMCLLSTNAQKELFTEDKFNFLEIRQEKKRRNLIQLASQKVTSIYLWRSRSLYQYSFFNGSSFGWNTLSRHILPYPIFQRVRTKNEKRKTALKLCAYAY